VHRSGASDSHYSAVGGTPPPSRRQVAPPHGPRSRNLACVYGAIPTEPSVNATATLGIANGYVTTSGTYKNARSARPRNGQLKNPVGRAQHEPRGSRGQLPQSLVRLPQSLVTTAPIRPASCLLRMGSVRACSMTASPPSGWRPALRRCLPVRSAVRKLLPAGLPACTSWTCAEIGVSH
jgi:hypothetical protein